VIPRVKIFAAALLSIALLLPQYTCRMYRALEGKVVSSIPDGADSSAYKAFRERHYAWEDAAWRQPSTWLPPALFLWPVPVLVFWGRLRGSWARRSRWIVETTLLAASIYFIWAQSDVGQRAVGAYLGIAANGLYAVACMIETRDVWGRARQRGSRVHEIA
jgi:hypothetical protein